MVNIVKQEVWHPLNTAEFQPKTWTALFFENNDENIGETVRALSRCIKATWYVDISAGRTKYIVFKDRVFRCDAGKSGKKEAKEYGLAIGIPASQLDWSD